MDSPAICEVEGMCPVCRMIGALITIPFSCPTHRKTVQKRTQMVTGGEEWRERRRNGKGRQRGRARSVIFLSAVPKNKGCNHSATPIGSPTTRPRRCIRLRHEGEV